MPQPKNSKIRTVEQLNLENAARAKKHYDKYKDDETYQKNKRKRYHAHLRPFIAFDGEGVGEGKEHRYVMAMTNLDEPIFNQEGISTIQALDYICESHRKHPNGIFVCYGASYDVNMILRDVPYESLKKLQAGKKIGYKNFTLEYRQRKCFIIAKYVPFTRHYIPSGKFNKKTGKEINKSLHQERVIIWDVIGFFQGSFVKNLKEFFPDEAEQIFLQLEKIEEGKKERGTFTLDMLGFMEEYTRCEVDALVALMNRLRDYCLEADIVLKRYDGAGAIAASLLAKYGIRKYYGVVEKKQELLNQAGNSYKVPRYVNIILDHYDKGVIPWQVQEASQYAYGGGRVECFKYGHCSSGIIWNYDERSSYPDKMRYLPNLAGGTWENSKTGNMVTNSLYKIYWEYPQDLPIYPFFYRDIFGSIKYPFKGYSWVWYPELEKAFKFLDRMNGSIEILDSWVFHPGDDIKPYAFVEELYKKRMEWKREGNGAQITLKLGPNSFYGKTVQRLGYTKETDRLPPFFQLQYGGLITSGTRASMFDTAMACPDSIIAIATDGIWSELPLLHLELGEGLGQWEVKKLKSFTSIQAGVYFGKTEEGEEIHHYRGFNEKTFNEEMVLQAWLDGKETLEVPTKRFITLGTGISSEERYNNKWRTWEEMNRNLSLKPDESGKRYDNLPWTHNFNPGYMLLDTQATEAHKMMFYDISNLDNSALSQKHPLPWEDKEVDMEMEEDEAEQLEIQEGEE